jgi:2-dehydro-3-deoxyphosphogluconate aldolase/(4S)-4-hydroxy-2-oxoglutarate aldolase
VSEPRALRELREHRLVSAIRAPSASAAVGAARAVADGGIRLLEITFTVPNALDAIAELKDIGNGIVGAGTVLTAQQAHDALAAGAQFLIAPNTSAEVARVALDAGVLYCPGAYTTSEILTARGLGAHVVKVYPVGVAGGPSYIQVIRDPLPDVPMLAAGGTNLANVAQFLEAGCMGVGLGGSLTDPKLVAEGRFAAITERARQFVDRIASVARPAALGIALGTMLMAGPFGGRAHASTEEFSTFDVTTMEGDDESLLDHVLLRVPREWRDEWERAPQAIRTSQGCLTSGQWFIDTDLKLRAPLGTRAHMGLDLRQYETDVSNYDFLDFSFQFPTPWGTPGFMFRPLYDKSRQDLGLTWAVGADTTAYQLEAIFTFEDTFNNLWAFRQTRVGGLSEPYLKRPYEPGLRFVRRGENVRVEVAGHYLTPSQKSIAALDSGAPVSLQTLWGTYGFASIEVNALGIGWEARTTNQQAASSNQVLDYSLGDAHDFRRLWIAEVSASRVFGERLGTELKWLYMGRDQHVAQPLGPDEFFADDRLLQLETTYRVSPKAVVRVGGMYDQIGVTQNGAHGYGSRKESRAYIGLALRFGRVLLQGVEGIELDNEPYDVWFVHDKGFLHLQTTF